MLFGVEKINKNFWNKLKSMKTIKVNNLDEENDNINSSDAEKHD